MFQSVHFNRQVFEHFVLEESGKHLIKVQNIAFNSYWEFWKARLYQFLMYVYINFWMFFYWTCFLLQLVTVHEINWRKSSLIKAGLCQDGALKYLGRNPGSKSTLARSNCLDYRCKLMKNGSAEINMHNCRLLWQLHWENARQNCWIFVHNSSQKTSRAGKCALLRWQVWQGKVDEGGIRKRLPCIKQK